MDENEQSYDGNYKIDPDFGAKLLGLVARTFYQFAAFCQSANSPEEVNFGVLSLPQASRNRTTELPRKLAYFFDLVPETDAETYQARRRRRPATPQGTQKT